jgi:hypothetical protein
MKLKIPDSVASQQDLNELILEVRDYMRWFIHESIKVDVHVRHVLKSPALSLGAQELIHDLGIKKPLSQEGLDELIEVLEDYVKTSPSITITLAAPATNGIKTTLVAWCRNNIKHNILVTLNFNSTLLGGMVVRYGSHVFDWSFKRQLLANREHFPEVLRNV